MPDLFICSSRHQIRQRGLLHSRHQAGSEQLAFERKDEMAFRFQKVTCSFIAVAIVNFPFLKIHMILMYMIVQILDMFVDVVGAV